MAVMTIAIFSIKFLPMGTRKSYPLYFLKLLISLIILATSLSFFMPYQFNTKLSALFSGVGAVAIFVLALNALINGYRPARFFVASFTVFLMGSVLNALLYNGIVGEFFIARFGTHMGALGAAVLLSLALADRINMLRRENDRANEEIIESYKRLDSEIDRGTQLQKENTALHQEIRTAIDRLLKGDKLASLGLQVSGIGHEIANPVQLMKNTRVQSTYFSDTRPG